MTLDSFIICNGLDCSHWRESGWGRYHLQIITSLISASLWHVSFHAVTYYPWTPWCPYGKGMALRGGDSGPGIREDARGEDSIMTVLLRFHDYFRTALRYFHVWAVSEVQSELWMTKTELFTVIHEIQINAYVHNLKRVFFTDIEIQISKFKSHGYIS